METFVISIYHPDQDKLLPLYFKICYIYYKFSPFIPERGITESTEAKYQGTKFYERLKR